MVTRRRGLARLLPDGFQLYQAMLLGIGFVFGLIAGLYLA